MREHEIKCPKCGEVLEEYGEYPYRKDEKGNTVCSAICRGCGTKYKIIIIEALKVE